MPSDELKVTDLGNRCVDDWGDDVRYESAGYAFPHAQVLENGLAMGRHNKTPVTDVPLGNDRERRRTGSEDCDGR